ncbi:hypothetical protein DFP74_4088 [Nocardiopsis sp. Huas11]|nr:hypothetical protein DFP74_4088 [Nocardiopsis sp. Huas11]
MNDHHGMDLTTPRRVFAETGATCRNAVTGPHALLHYVGRWSDTLRDLDLMEKVCGP